MPLICPYAKPRLAGTWRLIDGQSQFVDIACPRCGKAVIIDPRVVTIDDGTIGQPVGCAACTWCVPSVRLNGWSSIVSGSETITEVAAPVDSD